MDGLGRVKKRPGSRFWWVFFSVKGKRHAESSKSVRKADAQALLWKRLQEYRLVPGLVTRSTVDEVIDEYLRDAELREVRALDAAVRATGRAREFLGHELAAEIDPRRIYEYQQRLRKTLKPATVNQSIAFLRAAFKHAARNGLIARTPEFPRRMPERNIRTEFLEHHEYLAILGELPEWAHDPFRLAYHTGWRRNEVLSLRWDEVDFEGEALRLSAERSKNGESRVFPFLGELPDILARRRAVRILGLPLVFHRDGRGIGPVSYNVWFKRSADIAIGRRKIPHDCRRTAYRALLRIGVPEKTAREMVGWRSRAMADRYNVTSEADYQTVRELYNEHAKRKAAEVQARVLPFAKETKP